MKIKIHRGTHQIGGCVTEYESNGWHLFVDYGEELQGGPRSGALKVEGLTHGDLSKSALLITHYHGDHIGCIAELPEELPIYMSEIGCELQSVLSNRLKTVDNTHQKILERLQKAKTFKPGVEFSFGPFKIMPIIVDHSAFEACAFKIVADDVKAFHTGDFRTHGFRSGTLPNVIKKFVGEVDYVVCEGTNVRRPDATSVSEPELQRQFEAKFRENKNNIVYLSSSNIDRLFGLYHAARKAGRPFYVDAYQKRMMDVVTKRDHIWGKSRLYKYDEKFEPLVLQYEDDEDKVEEKGCVLIARANPLFDKFIEHIPGESHKYLSMWKGYVEESCEAYNPRLAKSLGKDFEYMHTSGHCDMGSMREFFNLLHPKAIIPIHTDNPEAFAELFCDEWPITLLNDGESISVISDDHAKCHVSILCVTPPYALDEKNLGGFKYCEDANFMLAHTKYCSPLLIGYAVEEESVWPVHAEVFDAEKKLLATYEYGEHHPGGKRFQEPCPFAKGEKVLAVFHAGYDVVVPATVIGPLSVDLVRESYEQDEYLNDVYSSFEDYLKEWNDWDWDEVAVHPLEKVTSPFEVIGTMGETEFVPRVYLFPYREVK